MADEPINLRHPLPGFEPRFRPDNVDGPVVSYRPHDFRVEYLAQSMEHWVRATFDRLDSHRVSRGERYPYKSGGHGSHDRVEVVHSSGWVAERYSYERRYYSNDYGFTRSVDEMLDEFVLCP